MCKNIQRKQNSMNPPYEHKIGRNPKTVTPCGSALAGIHLTKDNKQYKIYHFVDRHNHSLLNSADKRLLRINCQLKYMNYVKMIRGSSANIGPSTLYKMKAYLKSGYQYIEATIFDYQNARQDDVSFVGNKDAKMFVNLVEKCRLFVSEYFVEYKHVNRELQCIFWADEVCRLNYKKIGDSISIDGTFLTNMYAMVFFPNHKKFVNVGSALICYVKTPTYDWVLMAFLKCHGKQPLFVMKD
ncbi:hypothetical protein OSB04_006411 [Centaurea solstitialis]|uniref:Protein FAR1-RELATED SEQUENCE n=1 Tax=Centaurea solstitialis TaxID=347529 RepID=A0AA38TTF3_9ASTR|nr:hypothetical protein OSB04_006411 [Centaurea solstitialis]